MTKYEPRKTLQNLIDTYPSPQKFSDFEIPVQEKQDFLNFLFELNQRELIVAKFQISRMRETYGMPIEVLNILITKQGREHMEGNDKKASYIQNISINNGPETLNIAGRDINLSNEINVEKFIEILIGNIEKSNLENEEKESLIHSFKKMLATTTPAVAAGLIIESVKAYFSGN